jgi:hypothetical protein
VYPNLFRKEGGGIIELFQELITIKGVYVFVQIVSVIRSLVVTITVAVIKKEISSFFDVISTKKLLKKKLGRAP